ncbi:hypothetical protein AB0K12_05805 [Nonomuraea sp. NPDC049419]|uniref:hypothetical protein n=1 Tax=Nonomuraea sp. NPDC049419 TaxID=3155772 RepID=UPI00343116BE
MRRALAVLAVPAGQVPATQAASAAEPPAGRVALIGAPGLQWNDLTPDDTPNLWEPARTSAIGPCSART